MRDDDSSSSTSSAFTSPFAPLRATFPKSGRVQGETLQADKDSSWLGARMSPVAFDDDDANNEDRELLAPYHRALNNQSLDSSFFNERTALLGGRRGFHHITRKKSHSLAWGNENDALWTPDGKTKKSPPGYSWDIILCTLSGIHLGCMALHDLYVWYLAYRSSGYKYKYNYQSNKTLLWRLPWLSPSTSTLQRFGALLPWKVVHGQAWRMASSIFMSTSLVEYALVCCAWHTLRVGGSRPTWQWVGLYFMSTVTGQLWTIAWDDPSGVSGGAVWGTCGVLCAAGAAKPTSRFVLFVISIALFIVSSSIGGTNSSAMGAVGSSAFGWGYYGMGHILVLSQDRVDELPPSRSIRMLSGIMLISLWMIPLLWIAFADTYDTSTEGS